jgi:hypothetical protein
MGKLRDRMATESCEPTPGNAHLGQMLTVNAAHLSQAEDQDAWHRAISSSCSECNRLELTPHTSRSPNKPPDGNSGRLPIWVAISNGGQLKQSFCCPAGLT